MGSLLQTLFFFLFFFCFSANFRVIRSGDDLGVLGMIILIYIPGIRKLRIFYPEISARIA